MTSKPAVIVQYLNKLIQADTNSDRYSYYFDQKALRFHARKRRLSIGEEYDWLGTIDVDVLAQLPEEQWPEVVHLSLTGSVKAKQE